MIVQDLDHERGDFSEYSNGKVDASNRLSVTTAAAAIGKYGVACQLVDDGTKYYADHDFLWLDVSDWRFRIYVKLDDVSMASGDRFRLVHMTGGSGSSLYVFIGYSSSIGHYVRTFTYYDGGSYVVSSDVPLASTGWNRIECVIQRATSSVASDGRAAIEIDGVQKWEQTGLDIYDRLPADNIQVGVPRADLEPGTSGTIYFDGIAISNDSSVAIGDELGGVIWAQVDAANRNCRDMRNENSLFDNTVLGWSSTWASGGASFKLDVVPKGATIHNAYMVVRSKTADGAFTADVYGEDVDNGSLFDTALTSFTRTTASVAWSGNFDAANKLYSTPDISSVVSEVVSRSGWAAGNNITFEIDGTSSSAVNPYSYTDSATWSARLRVVYSEPTASDYPVDLGVSGSFSVQGSVVSSAGVSSSISSSVGVTDSPVSGSVVSGSVPLLRGQDLASVINSIVGGSVASTRSESSSVVSTASASVSVQSSRSILDSVLSGSVASVGPISVVVSVNHVSEIGYVLDVSLGSSASISSGVSSGSVVGASLSPLAGVSSGAQFQVAGSVSLSSAVSVAEGALSGSAVALGADRIVSAIMDSMSSVGMSVGVGRSSDTSVGSVSDVIGSVVAAITSAIGILEGRSVGISVGVIVSADPSFLVESVVESTIGVSGSVSAGVVSDVRQSLDLISMLADGLSVESGSVGALSLLSIYQKDYSAAKGVMLAIDVSRQSMAAFSQVSGADASVAMERAATLSVAVSSLVSAGLDVERVIAVVADEYGALVAMLVDVVASDSAKYTLVITDSGVSAIAVTDSAASLHISDDSGDTSVSDSGPDVVASNRGGGI